MDKRIKNSIKQIVPKQILLKVKFLYEKYKISKLTKFTPKKVDKRLFAKGIGLIAYIRHETGLGESARHIAKLIENANIEYEIKNIDNEVNIANGDHSYDYKIVEKLSYDINLFHINMHQMTRAFEFLGKNILNSKYNIAYWLWEMEEFPEEWIPLIDLFDEIWTPTEFISSTIRNITDKPVKTIRYGIEEVKINSNMGREYFGIPKDRMLYLIMFDGNSISERKNPMACIKAFKKAFKNTDKVSLIIKVNNMMQTKVNEIKEELSGYSFYIIDAKLSRVEVNSLINNIDVYISLHRAEGFGLVIAEAMFLGKPTVVTGYSGNMEFQNERSACLVSYNKVKVGRGEFPYKSTYLWAEPDIEVAAKYIKRLYEDTEYYNKISTHGKEQVMNMLSVEKNSKVLLDRYEHICEMIER